MFPKKYQVSHHEFGQKDRHFFFPLIFLAWWHIKSHLHWLFCQFGHVTLLRGLSMTMRFVSLGTRPMRGSSSEIWRSSTASPNPSAGPVSIWSCRSNHLVFFPDLVSIQKTIEHNPPFWIGKSTIFVWGIFIFFKLLVMTRSGIWKLMSSRTIKKNDLGKWWFFNSFLTDSLHTWPGWPLWLVENG